MDVKLVIRAPNQNIDDQIIYCNTDWTVSRLKNHLSEVYPNKPAVEEQKLIYSGHLLQDHLPLREIIRHEDLESCVHIFHLVWNARNNPVVTDQIPTTSQTLPNVSASSESAQARAGNMDSSSENVLRQRHNSSLPQSNFQFHQPLNTLPPYQSDPQVATQMAVMQQVYSQYLLQYWQSMNAVGLMGNVPLMPVASNIQTLQNNPNNSLPESPQQLGNERNNVPAVQVEENNDFINRDWLDHIFLYFRFLILLCIVYFYTTPERFMLVIIIVVVAFLYHEGWFVRQGIAEAVMGQRNRGQVDLNANAANNVIERPPSNDDEVQDPHELEAAMDGENPPHVQNPDVANNNNNHVFSPLTFLATFFSSLIPEAPPPVNIN